MELGISVSSPSMVCCSTFPLHLYLSAKHECVFIYHMFVVLLELWFSLTSFIKRLRKASTLTRKSL